MRKYFINSRGKVCYTENSDSLKHKLRIQFGNSFDTKEEAETKKLLVREILKSRHKSHKTIWQKIKMWITN